MKLVGLLRHAKSDWSDADKRDFDRDLNGRGRRGARLMGQHIRDAGMAWDLILASPAQRVRRTVEAALPGAAVQWESRLYLASSAAIADLLRDLPDSVGTVLVVAHNPGLQDMVLDHVAPSAEDAAFDEAKAKFPTAAFAVLELPVERWADLSGEQGRLAHFTRPRGLDPELGPDAD